MTTTTQLDRWIEQAEALGLTVTVERSDWRTIEQWSVIIRRPQVEVDNALDQYENSRYLHLIATRSGGKGKWTHAAISGSWVASYPVAKLSQVRYTLEEMAR